MTFTPGIKNTVSTVNSTSVNLGAGGIFIGTAEDVSNYSSVTINIFSDVDSAGTGAKFEFSPDGTNWNFITSATCTGNLKFTTTIPVAAKYFRTVYTNGSSVQTSFRLQTIYQTTQEQDQTPLSIDLYGRLQTTNPFTILDITQINNCASISTNPSYENLFIDQSVVNGGTTSYLTNESATVMSVSTTSDKVTRQSHRYFVYQPGKTFTIYMTGVLNNGSNANGVSSTIGYFDNQNGIFFQYNGGSLSVVLRSSVTGAIINTTVVQSSWNVDQLNGTGTSGITINPAFTQLFFIDLQWLGVGGAALGIVNRQKKVVCHIFRTSNLISTPFITSGNLPIRYEIESSNPVNAGSLKMICASVQSEGGYQPSGKTFSSGNGTTTKSGAATIEIPLVAIRLGSSFIRTTVVPLSFSVLTTTSANSLVRLRYYKNPAANPLTNSSFVTVSTNSAVEIDVASTALNTTGSIIMRESYFSSDIDSTTSLDPSGSNTAYTLSSNIAGTLVDYIVLSVVSMSGTNLYTGSLVWNEF